jgi:hypothetical protein
VVAALGVKAIDSLHQPEHGHLKQIVKGLG